MWWITWIYFYFLYRKLWIYTNIFTAQLQQLSIPSHFCFIYTPTLYLSQDYFETSLRHHFNTDFFCKLYQHYIPEIQSIWLRYISYIILCNSGFGCFLGNFAPISHERRWSIIFLSCNVLFRLLYQGCDELEVITTSSFLWKIFEY